jgi:hypothetical protein
MTTSRLILWVLSLLALTLLMVMNLWSVPTIQLDTAGQDIFDNRPSGYGLDDAKAIIGPLYEGERAGLSLYLGLQRKLDTLFPILFAVSVPWALWILTEAWEKPHRIGICLIAFIGPMCDLTENYLVAGLLRAGPDAITADMVARASAFSVTKWVLDGVAVATFALLSWNVLLNRWRRA